MLVRGALLLLVALLSYSDKGFVSGSCRPEWQYFVDQSSAGASQHYGPASIRDCLNYCVETTGCVAVDVEVNVYRPGCWPHFNASRLNDSNTYYLSGTTQYRLNRCGGGSTGCSEHEWEKYVGYTAVGATEFTGPRTIRQCLDYCEEKENCVGVDIDVNVVPLRCWVHFRSANLRPDNVFQQQNTTHYRLINRCPNVTRTASGCYNPEWEVLENQNSIGATQYSAARSVQECLDHCGNYSNCLAVDVNLNQHPPTCWAHFSVDYKLEKNIYSAPGTNQYRLKERCVNNTAGGSCRNTVWRIYRGQTAMGGTLHVGPRTIQQCLDYCNDTASCVGVDIDVNRVPVRCWVHVNDDDLLPDNIYVQQGTDSYKLIKRCPKSPSAPGCYNPEWEVIEDQNSVGATQYSAAQSVQECLDHCGSQDNCLAVDVDLSKEPPTCWPHFSADYKLERNVYSAPGTNQYRLTHRCASEPIRVTTTPAPTTTTIGVNCRQSAWKLRRGHTALGGTLHIGPRTIQQCLNYCNDTASCVAVDIDVNRVPVRCWVHVNADDLLLDNIYSQDGTDFYRLLARCNNAPEASPCYNPEWEVIEDQNSVGASQYSAAQSVQECLDHCGSQDDCVAVDVDLTQKPPTCWPHFSRDDLLEKNTYSAPGTNQYRLTHICASGPITVQTTTETIPSTSTPMDPVKCRQSAWRLRRGNTALGGKRHVGPRTIQQCLDYCNKTASCVAVDIDVNRVPVRCWVHVNADDLRPDNIYSQDGTDFYQIVTRCFNAPEASDGYNPDWLVLENQNAIGASQYHAAQSVQECLNHCGSQDKCVAVDVDLTQQPPTCWPHFSSDDLRPENVFAQQGTNQYRLLNRYASGPITETTTTKTIVPGERCNDHTWEEYENQLSSGGFQYKDAKSVKQCLDFCVVNVNCVGVDVNTVHDPPTCWAHFNMAQLREDNVFNQSGINQYRLIERCMQEAEGDKEVIIGLAVGLGVPLLIVIIILCLLLCCIFCRSRRVKPVEAINTFFPFPTKSLRSRSGTVNSTTSSYYTQKDMDSSIYDSPSVDSGYQNHRDAAEPPRKSSSDPEVV